QCPQKRPWFVATSTGW
ncbi:ATP-dependent protease La domain protein, partial [Vibrio parahaemolyticus V-223/04]